MGLALVELYSMADKPYFSSTSTRRSCEITYLNHWSRLLHLTCVNWNVYLNKSSSISIRVSMNIWFQKFQTHHRLWDILNFILFPCLIATEHSEQMVGRFLFFLQGLQISLLVLKNIFPVLQIAEQSFIFVIKCSESSF